MPRGKKIIIETKIDDECDRLQVHRHRWDQEGTGTTLKGALSSIANVFRVAQNLYRQKASEDELESKHDLFSVRSAYDYLKGSGVLISFRAFGGRIERGTVPFVKVGRKRYIPKSVLDDITSTKKEFHTVKEAYQEYKKANSKDQLQGVHRQD